MTDVDKAGQPRYVPEGIVVKGRRRSSWGLWILLGLVAGLLVMALIGPYVASGANQGDLRERLLGIGEGGHILGTDGLGRDVLARLVSGARPSLIAGLVPVMVAAVLGTALGVTAGLAGTRVHALIMRSLDVLYAFPAILLAILIAASLGAGTGIIVISLSIVLIPPVARITESETARLRGTDFMESARASGSGGIAIAARHVWPNVRPALLVYCTSLIGLAMVFAGGLAFLGLGVAPPDAEWGQMINEQRKYIFTNPQLALLPALVILCASLIFNLLGDSLRDFLDVRRHTR